MKANGKSWARQRRLYEKNASFCGFVPGDRVRITRKFPSLTGGWTAVWSEIFMTPLIGKEGRVVSLEGSSGIRVEFSKGVAYNFPYQSLERA